MPRQVVIMINDENVSQNRQIGLYIMILDTISFVLCPLSTYGQLSPLCRIYIYIKEILCLKSPSRVRKNGMSYETRPLLRVAPCLQQWVSMGWNDNRKRGYPCRRLKFADTTSFAAVTPSRHTIKLRILHHPRDIKPAISPKIGLFCWKCID